MSEVGHLGQASLVVLVVVVGRQLEVLGSEWPSAISTVQAGELTTSGGG